MKISIRTMLIAAVTALIVFLVSTILISAYGSSEATLQRLVRNVMENISQFTINKTENFLVPATEAADLVRKLTSNDVIVSQDKEQMVKFFYNQLTIYPQFAGIFFGEANGNFTYVSRMDKYVKNGFRFKTINNAPDNRVVTLIYTNSEFNEIQREIDPDDTYDPRKRPWYTKAIHTDGNSWTDPYVFFTSQNPGITTARSVYSKAGHFLGVIGIDIEIGELSAFISNLQIGKNGKAAIVDNTGTVIAYSDVEQIRIPQGGENEGRRLAKINELQDATIQATFASLREATGGYVINSTQHTMFKHEGENYHALFKPFRNQVWPWVIGIYIPEEDYLVEIKQTRFNTIIIALIFTVVSIILVLVISTRLTSPLVALQKESETVKQFDFDSSFATHTIFSEIQETSDSFSRMKTGLKAFEKYVPRTLVRSIVEGGSPPDKELKKLPVLFTDIENFTGISETLKPEKLVLYLNEYFDEVSKVITKYQGTIDKYMGDAVMAFWNAPVELKMPSCLACEAALEIQERIAKMNLVWAEHYRPVFKTRIGISTGDIIVGSIGSSERISYTVIGNTVNLASRLEGINKEFGTRIIISEETKSELRKEFITRRLDKIKVKGKSEPVMIYELLGKEGTLPSDVLKVVENYETALSLHLENKNEEAINVLTDADNVFLFQDTPSKILLHKLKQTISGPK